MNTHRDSYASYVGHYPILAYFAVAENESIGRERYNFMQVSTLTYIMKFPFFKLKNQFWIHSTFHGVSFVFFWYLDLVVAVNQVLW